MTDKEVAEAYADLKEYWGDALVDFEVYPKIFSYQVRLWKYYTGLALQEQKE